MRFKVRNAKTGSELEVVASKLPQIPGTWFTRSIKAKVGDSLIVSNGLGLSFPAVRISDSEGDKFDKPPARIIGETIKVARQAQGLTQKDVANELGVSIHYIRSVEQGQKNLTILQLDKIVQATGAKGFNIVIW